MSTGITIDSPGTTTDRSGEAPPRLIRLPFRRGRALENMLLDWRLLGARDAVTRAHGDAFFRHYGWAGPAWTIGYGQERAAVLAEPQAREVDLQRRPTGGGIVDHRHDWTWALIIPASHPVMRGHVRQVYPLVHGPLAEALRSGGAEVAGFEQGTLAVGAPFRCFTEPQGADLADLRGRKAAGAAIKKTRQGILVQGSVARASFPGMDWAALEVSFHEKLATILDLQPAVGDLPALDETAWTNEPTRLRE